MTLQDIASYITMLAGVIAAGYAVISYHMPKSTPVSSPQRGQKTAQKAASGGVSANRWKPFWPIVLAIIAWSAAGFDYIGRHWLFNDSSKETGLSADNARMDVKQFSPNFKEDNSTFFLNIFLINNGRTAASGLVFNGFSMTSSTPLDSDWIDAMFRYVKAKLKKKY
jgi:hypothetical protein